MHSLESLNKEQEFVKANSLNRIIARSIDILIVAAMFETFSKAGYFGGLLYILIADGLFNGRSVGKRLIGLRVILSETKTACGYKESIIRNSPFAVGYIFFGLLKLIPFIGWLFAIIIPAVILCLEGLIMLGSEKGTRFGDEIAKTQVVEVEGRG